MTSSVSLGWGWRNFLNIGVCITLQPLQEALGVHNAGPYYVFAINLHVHFLSSLNLWSRIGGHRTKFIGEYLPVRFRL